MAQEVTLTAESGRPKGSRASRRLRRDGRIPGILYGHGIEPIPVSVNGRDLRAALTTDAGVNALLNLEVSGAQHLAVAKQLQRDPVRGTVRHVDFQVVRRDEVISAEVAVHLVGEATEVIKADGVVTQEITSITVRTTPANIPPAIEVDVTGLAPGGQIRGADLRLPAGVEIDLDPEATIVSATISTTGIEAEEAAGEAEEAAEGTQAGEEETGAREEATAGAEAGGDTSAGGDAAE